MDYSKLEKATQIIAPTLISTDETRSNLVSFSPKRREERMQLNTSVRDDTELTVIISAIDSVTILAMKSEGILTNQDDCSENQAE